MFTVDKNIFFIICLVFGLFWVFVEGLIAYFVYKMYKTIERNSK